MPSRADDDAPDRRWRAVILDMDGVVTRTAALHAKAWKDTFDAFLAQRSPRPGEDLTPFDIDGDYRLHVDGRPRFEGIRAFLAARGIRLPEGDLDSDGDAETVHGLGHRKNAIFRAMLDRDGVETYPDAVARLDEWRRQGLRTALITSSRNGRAVIEAAEASDLFDTIIDGVDAERAGLRGKPAPDVFVEAARLLGVEPREAIVIEDAIPGVEAGRAGGFGLVVGVARDSRAAALREHGADVVVRNLLEFDNA